MSLKKYVTDTMALILHLENRKMPENAKNCFLETERGEAEMIVPAMVLVELAYLSEKKRIQATIQQYETHAQKYTHYKTFEWGLESIKKAFAIDDIPELHDRLIAGTAFLLNVKLITNDPLIQNSKYVETIWK